MESPNRTWGYLTYGEVTHVTTGIQMCVCICFIYVYLSLEMFLCYLQSDSCSCVANVFLVDFHSTLNQIYLILSYLIIDPILSYKGNATSGRDTTPQ